MLIKINCDHRLSVPPDKILRQEPVVHRVKNFDEDSGKEIFSSLNKAVCGGQPVFPVVIDSYGGQVYGLLSIMEAFRSSPIPIATIIQGKAMSCGAMLAAMGTKGLRYISPHAHILIHHVSSFTHGIVPQIKEDVRNSEYLDKQIFEMVSRHCGHPPEYFLDQLKPKEGADWYIKPEEALKLGLVDEIRCPSFDVKISVEMELG